MFTHPTLLWGLLFLAAPLLIHLINLLRRRRIEWGAMEFLLAAFKRHRTRVRMKELLLLLMRLAAVALMVLLVAQPVLKNRLGALAGGIKTHHIFVLDDSFSMGDTDGEKSVFQTAKNVLTQFAEESAQLPVAQQFTLLRTSQARPAHIRPDFQAQRIDSNFVQQVRSILGTFEPSHESAGPTAGLNAVEEIAPETDDENRIVYVLSDFRKRDWFENSDLSRRLEELKEKGVPVRLIDCANVERPNLAISNLVPMAGTRAAGTPLFMSVDVRNFGDTPATNVVVHPETRANGESQTLPAIRIPEIPPGGVVSERFAVRFPLAGSHTIAAALDPDAVMDDNYVCASVDFPAFESVLVIESTSALDAKSPARTLATALSPGGSVNTGLSIRIESPRFLATNPLDDFSVIYLADVATLDPQGVAALEEFLQNGGGVCIFAGQNTDPIFAQKWYREGKGFFPALLRQPTDLAVDYLQKIPDVRVSEHPIFRIFSGKTSALLNSVNIAQYYSLEDESLENLIPMEDDVSSAQRRSASNAAGGELDHESGSADVRIIAALRNNAPLVLEKRYGRGWVILFLTSVDSSWNNWSRGNPSYVVMLLQLQAYLASSRHSEETLCVGEKISFEYSPEEFSPEVRFLTPEGEPLRTIQSVPQKNGQLLAESEWIATPGVYSAEMVPKKNAYPKRFFAINVDAKEGDVAKISSEELAQSLKTAAYEFFSSADFRLGTDVDPGFRLSDWLLYLLALWLLLEMLLATSASYHLKNIELSTGSRPRKSTQGGAK
ncbi:MAG: BatA domain-containing protein [Planctomycetia bacterium]|nr:BatA domain-containing protein [Planctomycetia bacterium]